MIYDIDLEENLDLLLRDLGVHDGSMLRIASDDDGAQLDLVIVSKDTQDAAVCLEKPLPLPLIRKQPPPTGEKRGLDEEEDALPAKKAKTETDNDIILVEEDQDGSILID